MIIPSTSTTSKSQLSHSILLLSILKNKLRVNNNGINHFNIKPRTRIFPSNATFECPNCSKRSFHSHSLPSTATSTATATSHSTSNSHSHSQANTTFSPHDQTIHISETSSAKSKGKAKQAEVLSSRSQSQFQFQFTSFQSNNLSGSSFSHLQSCSSSSSTSESNQKELKSSRSSPSKPPIPKDSESESSKPSFHFQSQSHSQPLWSLSIPSNHLDNLLNKASRNLIKAHERDKERVDKSSTSNPSSSQSHFQECLESIHASFSSFIPTVAGKEEKKEQMGYDEKMEELDWLLIGRFLGRDGNGISRDGQSEDEDVDKQIHSMLLELERRLDLNLNFKNQDEIKQEGESQLSNQAFSSSQEASSSSQPRIVSTFQSLNHQDSISITFQIYLSSKNQFDSLNLLSSNNSSPIASSIPSSIPSQSFASSSSNSTSENPSSINSTSDNLESKSNTKGKGRTNGKGFTIHYLRKSTLHLLFGSLLNFSQIYHPFHIFTPQSNSEKSILECDNDLQHLYSSPFRKASIILKDERLKTSHARYLSRKLIGMISNDYLKRRSFPLKILENSQNQRIGKFDWEDEISLEEGYSNGNDWFEIDGKKTLIELNNSMISIFQRTAFSFNNLDLNNQTSISISIEIKQYLKFLSNFISSSSSTKTTSSFSIYSISKPFPKSPSSLINSSKKSHDPISETLRKKFQTRSKKKIMMMKENQMKLNEKLKTKRIKEREEIMNFRIQEREKFKELNDLKEILGWFLKEFLKLNCNEFSNIQKLNVVSNLNINSTVEFNGFIKEVFEILLRKTPSPPSISSFNNSNYSIPAIQNSKPNISTSFNPNSKNPLPQPPLSPIPKSQQIALNLISSIPKDFPNLNFINQDILLMFLKCENFSQGQLNLKLFQHSERDEKQNYFSPSDQLSLNYWKNIKKSSSLLEKRKEISEILIKKYALLNVKENRNQIQDEKMKFRYDSLKKLIESKIIGHSKGRWELISVPKEARKSWKIKKSIQEEKNEEEMVDLEKRDIRVQAQELKIWVWKEGNVKGLIKDLIFFRRIQKIKEKEENSRLSSLSSLTSPSLSSSTSTSSALSGKPLKDEPTNLDKDPFEEETSSNSKSNSNSILSTKKKILDSQTRSSSFSLSLLIEFSFEVQSECIKMFARESRWNMVYETIFHSFNSFGEKLEKSKTLDNQEFQDETSDVKTNSDSKLSLDLDVDFPVKLMNWLLKEILKRKPVKLKFSKDENENSIESIAKSSIQESNSSLSNSSNEENFHSLKIVSSASSTQPSKSTSNKHSFLKRSKRPSRLDSISNCLKLLEKLTLNHEKILKPNEETFLILMNSFKDWKKYKSVFKSKIQDELNRDSLIRIEKEKERENLGRDGNRNGNGNGIGNGVRKERKRNTRASGKVKVPKWRILKIEKIEKGNEKSLEDEEVDLDFERLKNWAEKLLERNQDSKKETF